jgi:hypothetical protein
MLTEEFGGRLAGRLTASLAAGWLILTHREAIVVIEWLCLCVRLSSVFLTDWLTDWLTNLLDNWRPFIFYACRSLRYQYVTFPKDFTFGHISSSITVVTKAQHLTRSWPFSRQSTLTKSFAPKSILLWCYPRLEGDHLGDPGVDGRIILRWIFGKWDGGMKWIELAQDRDRWRDLVNAVMNLLVP